MRIIRLHKGPTPKGTAEQCVKGLLDSNTRLDARKSSQPADVPQGDTQSLAVKPGQATVTIRLGTGPSCVEFALLARPRATSRATDSFYVNSTLFMVFSTGPLEWWE
jgi:hypothetical protein